MNMKKIWIVLAIALVSFCTVSCGGDDDDYTSNNGGENGNSTEVPADETAYIATEQVKTITLKPNNNEYLIYKDYYWKHKLYLNGNRISFNSYYGEGNGWTLTNKGYSGNYSYYVGIKDLGEMNSIYDITEHKIGIYIGSNSSTWSLVRDNNNDDCCNFTTFKPSHGYEVAFFIGAGRNLKHMRMFPTNYTLDNNDVLTSVTIQYQLY